MNTNDAERRTHAVVLLVLAVLFGWLGADRFANRRIGLGLVKLVTIGGLGFWWLIDIVIFAAQAISAFREPGGVSATSSAISHSLSPSRPTTLTDTLSLASAPPHAHPRTTRREHVSPAPRGDAISPWVTVSRTVPVAGEFYKQATYERLFQGLPKTGEWLTLDLDADLFPDPHNPYSESGSAVSVWVRGMQAGFLESSTSSRYTALLRDLAEAHGQFLRVPARVSGIYQGHRSCWHAQVQLGLPEPEDILPRNQLPDGEIELIPSGRIIQVAGEDQHMDVLRRLVDPSRPTSYAATLRVIHEVRPRSAYEAVEVQIDGKRVGTLSKVTGAQVIPLVALIEGAGRIPVVRATVAGNELQAEVKLRLIRAAEARQDWIQELRTAQVGPRIPTNPRGDEFDWDDDAEAGEA